MKLAFAFGFLMVKICDCDQLNLLNATNLQVLKKCRNSLLLTVRIVHKSLAARVCMRNVCGIKRAKTWNILYTFPFTMHNYIRKQTQFSYPNNSLKWETCVCDRQKKSVEEFLEFLKKKTYFVCNTCACLLLIIAALIQVSRNKNPVNNANELTIYDCFA